MSALLGTAIIWPPEDYVFFKQCGALTISPDIQNIGFNCLFCTGICLQADIFLQHLQEQHKDEVYKLYESENTLTLVSQESPLLANNFSIVSMDLQNATTNTVLTTQVNTCITSNQTQSEEFKENCINLNNLMALEESPSTTDNNDLNVVLHEMENNSLIATNRDLQNLIAFNPCKNPSHNRTTQSNNVTSLATNITNTTTDTFTLPTTTNYISGSSSSFTYSPNDNECEIGDGEDSGIMLVQSPCHSDCSGLSDCIFAEDSNSKSPHTSKQHPTPQDPENEETSKPTLSSKGKYFKTPAMRKALTDKSLIKYLLEIYRKNEKLWNPKHPAYKYNAPRSVYKELSPPLLKDTNCSLTGEEIFGIITELRGRFRRELKKFETRKGKHKTRLWFFEKMQFLQQIIEEKRQERYKCEDTCSNSVVTELTNRQILSYLLDLYRQNECLWNPRHQNFKACNKQEVYKKVSEQLKVDKKIDMTAMECLNEIKKLRIRYCKELRTVYKLKDLYTPNLWCFDEMAFLKPVLVEKIANNFTMISKTFSPHTKRKQDFQKSNEIKFHNLEQQLKFIEIYQSFSTLWDVNHPDYRSTNYRRKALIDMLAKINATFETEKLFELEQLEKTIYLLSKDFSNEKHKRLTKNYLNKSSKISFIVYEKLNEFLSMNVGPFRCDNCQRICKTYDQYKIHKSTHDGTLPFICTLCGKGFQAPSNLTIHIRRHRRDFPYKCELCSKSFATSTEVNIHMRSHTGERPYACESCDKRFKTWSFYDLHKRIHLNQSNFHCPICDKAFYERNRFTDHMNIHLNIRKHQCHQCGKGFTTLGNLKKHLDLHASVKKYKCLPCGKSFAQLASLRWHRKTQHNKE